jgi:hypothetical protein
MISRWLERALALAAAILVPLALRFRPLPEVLALCDRMPVLVRRRHAPQTLAYRVYRWMSHGRGPWASSCLTRSLVLYAMMRQHGYEPRFAIGVAGSAREFAAHAWVTLRHVPVMDPRHVETTYRPLMSHGV